MRDGIQHRRAINSEDHYELSHISTFIGSVEAGHRSPK